MHLGDVLPMALGNRGILQSIGGAPGERNKVLAGVFCVWGEGVYTQEVSRNEQSDGPLFGAKIHGPVTPVWM